MTLTIPWPRLAALAALVAALFIAIAPAPARAQGGGEDQPDVSVFYEELDEDGRWVSHPEYGYVFVPDDADDEDWRPYTRGRWIWTEDYGWYWLSKESFGWATYHYGRWSFDDDIGWFWVPGTRWAPAWVVWRSSDEHIGWAPLPPDSYVEDERVVYRREIYDEPRYARFWSFVVPAMITAPLLYRYIAPPRRSVSFFASTRPQTNYVFVNRHIVNRGVDVRYVERISRKSITPVRLVPTTTRTARGTAPQAGALRVYQPNLVRGPGAGSGAPKSVFMKAPQGNKLIKAPVDKATPPPRTVVRDVDRGGTKNLVVPPSVTRVAPATNTLPAGRPGPGTTTPAIAPKPAGTTTKTDDSRTQPHVFGRQPGSTQPPKQVVTPPSTTNPAAKSATQPSPGVFNKQPSANKPPVSETYTPPPPKAPPPVQKQVTPPPKTPPPPVQKQVTPPPPKTPPAVQKPQPAAKGAPTGSGRGGPPEGSGKGPPPGAAKGPPGKKGPPDNKNNN